MVVPELPTTPGADCRLDASPDLGARPDAHGTLTLRIRVGWAAVVGPPIGCARSAAVPVRLVDATTRRPLPIPDDNRDVKPRDGAVILSWTNWCPGPAQVAALTLHTPEGDLFWPVVAPPPCLDPGQPTMLSVAPGR